MYEDLIKIYDSMEKMGKDYVAPYGYTKKRVLFRVHVPDEIVTRNLSSEDTFAPFIANRSSDIKAHPLVDTVLYTGAVVDKDIKRGPAKVASFVSLVRKMSSYSSARNQVLSDQLEQIASLVESGKLGQMVAPLITQEDKPAELENTCMEFSFDGCTAIHESEDFKSLWLDFLKEELVAIGDVRQGVSAISGEVGQIARLAGNVKGASGGRTSGATLTSFNNTASHSPAYGGSGRDYRFPMLHQEAHKITQALEALLKTYDNKVTGSGKEIRVPRYRRTIGDAMDVLWFSPSVPRKSVTGLLLEGIGEEDVLTLENIRAFFREATGGKEVAGDTLEAADALKGNYLLIMLAANSARISVLSTLRGSLADLKANLEKYFRDYGYLPPKSGATMVAPSVRDISEAVTSQGSTLSAPLMRQIALCILEGKSLPTVLVSHAIQRIAKELCREPFERKSLYTHNKRRKVCEVILSAYAKNLQKGESMKQAELLGRLFAQYVQAQEKATDNRTLQGTYYSALMSSPAAVLPILDKLYNKGYVRALQEESPWVLKRVTELKAAIAECDCPVPKRLTQDEQCLFIGGYALEESMRYTKKADRKEDNQ